jgi:predicted nucleotidyltransferase
MKHESDDFESDVARPAQIASDVARLARSILGKDVEVIWFGSWPQGKARPHSDIDVAVSIGAPISPERMSILQEAVDDLPTLYEIEIVDFNAAGLKLREEILKHGEHL